MNRSNVNIYSGYEVNKQTMLDYILLLITAIFWGVTNVLIKQGSSGINSVKADSKLKQVLQEIKFLIFNWKVRGWFVAYFEVL